MRRDEIDGPERAAGFGVEREEAAAGSERDDAIPVDERRGDGPALRAVVPEIGRADRVAPAQGAGVRVEGDHVVGPLVREHRDGQIAAHDDGGVAGADRPAPGDTEGVFAVGPEDARVRHGEVVVGTAPGGPVGGVE